jgi:hypothetical protein
MSSHCLIVSSGAKVRIRFKVEGNDAIASLLVAVHHIFHLDEASCCCRAVRLWFSNSEWLISQERSGSWVGERMMRRPVQSATMCVGQLIELLALLSSGGTHGNMGPSLERFCSMICCLMGFPS